MASENAVSAEEIKVDVKKMQVSDTDVAIEIVGMHKWYGEFHVLKDINLKVMRGERIVICGPSGSGKSTMIRCINRLEEHQQGRVIVNGTELTGYIASETADEISIKMIGGTTEKHKKAEIAWKTPMQQSLMPEGLAEGIGATQLENLVAYLWQLKKK